MMTARYRGRMMPAEHLPEGRWWWTMAGWAIGLAKVAIVLGSVVGGVR